MRRRPSSPPPVPFSPQAARAHRAGLGLTPEQVAEAMAAHGVRLLPAHVAAWEAGELRPSEEEFVALSRALWCPPVQLMGVRPATLRDFRLSRELTREQAARRIGVSVQTYARAEDTGHWDADEEQSLALAHALGLTLRALVHVTGRQDELELLLRQVVDGRWQARLRAVARLVPVPDPVLGEVLADLQDEYLVPAHWGSAVPDAARPPARPLADRFWELLSRPGTDVPV
ncbi:helix-turn-helix transcriptional regulator [Kitasatospora sp. NPDC051914]|uniref:helix-turn-helix domain-containing protein n=1 Tax=Kitasatospora sp. NPDC051914 TaxID=3154945 RepID=UPI00343923C2